ncbi:hypothetical protein [Faecalibaculum rodentium]|uniref:hypothetical protein n=1 Tax=Faecalibaculum rodentium TaxID=1702221 RepID=UPI0023F5885E|nr:hypothetical protein [Faecalibaculum rodentium]
MKAPVAYFSPTGTTKGKAMELAADIGGDLFWNQTCAGLYCSRPGLDESSQPFVDGDER